MVIFATDNVEIYTKQYESSCYEQHDGCHDIFHYASIHFKTGSKCIHKVRHTCICVQIVITQLGTYCTFVGKYEITLKKCYTYMYLEQTYIPYQKCGCHYNAVIFCSAFES